jgi:hypothetical protein
LIDCSNVSDKEGFFVFSGFWISLNLVQLFIILALLLFIFVKLDIYKYCACDEKNEKKIEERLDYEKPRVTWDALALPILQIDRVESIIYEDVGPLKNKPNSSYLSIQPPDADEAGDYENIPLART